MTVIINKPFELSLITKELNKLKIEQKGLNVLTTYDGRLISNTDVSKKYGVFDFSAFSLGIVNEIENYFTPDTFTLFIGGGFQELRLIGESVLINGDAYQKMMNIVSSTDKSRALSINIGLIRVSNNTGLIAALSNDRAGFYTKHYVFALGEKLAEFVAKLPEFDIFIQEQIKTIEDMVGKTVKFSDFAKKMVLNTKGIVQSTILTKFKAFCQNVRYTTFAKTLNAEQYRMLYDSKGLVEGKTAVDFDMPVYEMFSVYMEVFKNLDSSVQKRESMRFLEAVK